MSRVLKVNNGDYRLQVQGGGNIILDTGTLTGTVTITGNLDVLGTQTIVESTNSYINDNIIQLNYDPNSPYSGNGISSALGYQAGIEIWRGSRDAAQLVFSEQVNHYDGTTATNVVGTFQLKTRNTSNNSTSLSGLQVRTITTDGTADLIFDLQGGSPVLRIANATSYESRCTDANDIPNVQFVQNYVSATSGVANVSNIHYPLTGTQNSSVNTTASTIDFTVGLQLRAQLSSAGMDINNIRLVNDTITNTGSNNLILSATTNNVEVNAVLNLDNQSVTPSAVSGKTKIYSKSAEGPGRTGIYFANSTPNADELVSKNRAVLLSILL